MIGWQYRTCWHIEAHFHADVFEDRGSLSLAQSMYDVVEHFTFALAKLPI